jgi:PAS domain S-box-containing protein
MKHRHSAPAHGYGPATFADLAETCSDPVFVLDTEARLLYVNEAGAQMLGRTREALVGRAQEELFPPPIAARHTRAVREIVASGESRRVENQDMRGLRLDTRLRPVRDERGEIVAIIGIAQDVTARRAIRESERRYRATIEHATIGIANLTLDGHFISVNERLCEILGHSAEELTRTSLGNILAPEGPGDLDLRLSELGEGRGASFAREARGRRHDGTTIWLHVAISLVRDEDEQPHELVAIFEDVSSRRLLEERLRQAEKLEAIGQLAGGVAHDFNNQLTAIIGYADLLLGKLENERQRHYATHILNGARRSADLTRQLLAFARKGQFQGAPVDVHALIAQVAEILAHSIDKRIRIESVRRANRPFVFGDAGLLQNALLNLALNARDAMPDGGRLGIETDSVLIGPGLRASHPPELGNGAYVLVTVSDTGCGMSEAIRARLFEPFFTTKEPGKGTGLGLAAVFGTVQRHGGAITVTSTVGQGSAFRLYLPTLAGAEAKEDAGASAEDLPAAARVLVVDDERVVRELVTDVLTSAGFTVETAENGRLGVDLYRRHWQEIDLVILDLVMPEMDGAEAFVWMRRVSPNARVLVASGYSSDGDAQSLLARGAVGFLQKPFDRAALLQRVREALAAPVEPQQQV